MHARDHLLPRIAAFVERQGVEQIEVQHLRHEVLHERCADRGNAEADLRERRVVARRARERRRETVECGAAAERVPQPLADSNPMQAAARNDAAERRAAC